MKAITFIMDGKVVRPVDRKVTYRVLRKVPMYDWPATRSFDILAENREDI